MPQRLRLKETSDTHCQDICYLTQYICRLAFHHATDRKTIREKVCLSLYGLLYALHFMLSAQLNSTTTFSSEREMQSCPNRGSWSCISKNKYLILLYVFPHA